MEGLSVCGMKPIETGCTKQGDVLIPSDGMFLKDISHMNEQITHIAPYCFETPLAPMVAAEMENVDIETEEVGKRFDELALTYEAVVVEGIGGLLVPIKEDCFVADLARTIGLPLLVVASPFLGTINHTLLTVDYALKKGLEVAGIILNYHRPAEGTPAEETNPTVIRRLSSVPLIGIMPYLEDIESETLDRAVVKNFDLEVIRKYL